MNAVLTVLEAVDRQGEVTRIALQANIALEAGDTPRARSLFQQAAEIMESGVAGLKKSSERDLARFLVATHYYKGGHYDRAAKVCERIQEKRLPSRARHIYPPFLKTVRERSAPDYAEQCARILFGQKERVKKERDSSAAQKVIEILIENPYLLPHDQMANLRAKCAEVLGRQRAATLFFRDAWRFNPEDPTYLSSYLDSLCKEGKHAEAWAIIEEDLANCPGARSSINAMYVINAILVRDGRPNTVADQEKRQQRRADQWMFFETALRSYRSLAPEERKKLTLLMDFAFLFAWLASLELNDPRKQLETLNNWVEQRPYDPLPRVLRGMMAYPGDIANTDFREAIRLRSPDPLPYYYLAYQALGSRNFHECDGLCTSALQRNPEADIRALLLSWQAIARWNLGLDKPHQIRRLFDEARQLKPDDPVIASYAEAFKDHQGTPQVPVGLPLESEENRRERMRQYADGLQNKIIEGMNPIFSAA
jgi:tetratricopeptide (TPR) repeat protein